VVCHGRVDRLSTGTQSEVESVQPASIPCNAPPPNHHRDWRCLQCARQQPDSCGQLGETESTWIFWP
jgi:hypothetical protein